VSTRPHWVGRVPVEPPSPDRSSKARPRELARRCPRRRARGTSHGHRRKMTAPLHALSARPSRDAGSRRNAAVARQGGLAGTLPRDNNVHAPRELERCPRAPRELARTPDVRSTQPLLARGVAARARPGPRRPRRRRGRPSVRARVVDDEYSYVRRRRSQACERARGGGSVSSHVGPACRDRDGAAARRRQPGRSFHVEHRVLGHHGVGPRRAAARPAAPRGVRQCARVVLPAMAGRQVRARAGQGHSPRGPRGTRDSRGQRAIVCREPGLDQRSPAWRRHFTRHHGRCAVPWRRFT